MKVLVSVEAPGKAGLYANVLPCLGPLGIVSYLRSRGISVDYIDRNVDTKTAIDYCVYDHILFSVTEANVENTIRRSKYVKGKTDVQVFWGGPFCSCYPEELIVLDYIDVVALGEGEYSCYEYLTVADKRKVKGLYLKDENGKAFFTGQHDYKIDLNELPFPAIHLTPVSKYRVPLGKGRIVSSISTSRGCPHNCTFCYSPLGKKWRGRRADLVIDEIEWQVNELGVKEICFVDDNFYHNKDRGDAILKGIIDRKIKANFQFLNGVRIDNFDRETIRLLKKAGFWKISIAPESGDQRTIDRVKKGVKKESFFNIVKWCREERIVTTAFFMVGFPWEDKESIDITKQYIRKLNPDLIQVARVDLYPKTELYEEFGQKVEDVDILKDKASFINKATDGYSSLDKKEFADARKSINREFYVNPLKAISLFIKIGPFRMLRLLYYALITANI